MNLQLTPGTDLALANGLLHIAVSDGLIDEEFIAFRTMGFDAVRRTVSSHWPDRVERITGVPVKQLVRAAHILGEAATAMVLMARGPEQRSKGVDNVLAFINLALALGKAGRPLCGYGCLTGQGNGQGGREHGQKADQLPGYRRLDNEVHRAHVAGVWGVDPADLPMPGPSAYEMLDGLGTEGGVRATCDGLESGGLRARSGSHYRAARFARLPRGLRLLPLLDGRARGRRPAHHPVGRGGGHHDESGGARPPPPARGRSSDWRSTGCGDSCGACATSGMRRAVPDRIPCGL